MGRERRADPLLRRLVEAVEASLPAAEAPRDAVQEILRRGADTGIFFAGKGSRGTGSSELTAQGREVLRAVSIKPDRRAPMRVVLIPFLLAGAPALPAP